MSIFSDAIAGGQATIQTVAGADIVYRRSDLEPIPLRATIGRTEFSSAETEVVVVVSRIRDFIVNTVDLIDATDAPFLPEIGDIIEETVGDKVFVYEVLALANDEAWRYSDFGRNQIRIHTKETEVR